MIFHNIPYRKKLLLSFIGFSLLIIFIIGIFIVFIIEKKHSDKTMITAEKLYHQKLSSLKSYIGEIEGKLFALKNSKFFIDYLHDMNEKNLKMAEEAFFNIAHCSSQIMQLRYIDTYGIERIRVDRNASNSSPYLVPRDQLQTKKNRYYFTQISQTPDNLVWYSNIDLNIEHGEVEKPIKPVLRVGLSHYENNTLQGILIVNIFMKDFLDTLVSSNEYDIYLIDKGDNILVSTDNSHNWSKYINLDKLTARNVKFSDLNLEVPIYSNTLDFNNGEALKIIIKPKNTSLIQALTEETKYILLLLILVFILSFPLAYFFSKYPAKLEKELEEYNNYLEIRVNKAIDLYKENEKMLFHQHRLAQMGEMISMIAHQWRQPLTTIMALVSGIKTKIALEGEYSKEALDERLSSIETQATNLSQIINSFKDFYSSETSIIETSIDLVVESSLDIVDAQFKANDIIVNTNLKDKKTIKISPSYLKQAIIAILQNAQEAFKEQQAQDKIIEVSTYTREDSHIIEISDNAGGIPEEIIENIFTPYFSTKESKNGTGLGLYMAKMIIDKHSKGTLCVNNNEDGAVFRITI